MTTRSTTPEMARVEVGDEPTPTTVDELAPLYRQMLAIRRMEEASAKAYSVGKIGGFLHLIIGQEAVCTGAIAAIRPDDYVVATYREHGHAYAKGIAARPIMAELYGKKTGLVKGLGARCTCSTGPPTSSAATASSAATCRSRPARRSRPSTAATAG
jgi:TPP-dependent pyruvate/acetoin dehydrogenase alpha subunit